ncbi:aminoglycoside adenylyltransferase domain-containing protein, partial [Vineibacter terrae]|uniref:aminoglycoside adenylyltransferase domain-containing protein n=1 Tax=Vineibacter terrae TaxID=2586908 RepID=UPI002E31722A
GSLAMGSFYPPKSDVDILIVAEDLSERQSQSLYKLSERYHQARPFAGGLEVNAVRLRDAESPRHPLPSLGRFSETTSGPSLRRDGQLPTDEDLIAHLAVSRHRGVALFGPPPSQVIGEIPWVDYTTAIAGDVRWILEDDHLTSSPCYGILNLCRWAMIGSTDERIVPSKEEGGIWGLSNLPHSMRELVRQALAAYRSDAWPGSIKERQMMGGPWNRASLLSFRDEFRMRDEQHTTSRPALRLE